MGPQIATQQRAQGEPSDATNLRHLEEAYSDKMEEEVKISCQHKGLDKEFTASPSGKQLSPLTMNITLEGPGTSFKEVCGNSVYYVQFLEEEQGSTRPISLHYNYN